MDDENYIELDTISAKIDENGKMLYNSEILKELKENGFEDVKLKIYGNASSAAKYSGLDIESFNQISETQKIPPSVVYYFLKSKGTLKSNILSERILNYEW